MIHHPQVWDVWMRTGGGDHLGNSASQKVLGHSQSPHPPCIALSHSHTNLNITISSLNTIWSNLITEVSKLRPRIGSRFPTVTVFLVKYSRHWSLLPLRSAHLPAHNPLALAKVGRWWRL